MYKDENHYTLYKRKSYWGYYYYDKEGKRHFRSTGKKTKYEATKVITDRIISSGLGIKKAAKDITLREFAKDFYIPGKCPMLKERERTGKSIAVTSRIQYRRILETNIFPMLGKMPLRQITDSEIKGFEDKLIKKGLTNKYINLVAIILKAVLGQALKEARIERNPFDLVERLKDEESTRKAFTLEQVQRILNGGKWDSEISRLAFKMSCLTGLRIGEIQALRCRILRSGATIEVYENYSPECKLIKDTKNHKTRYVPFPESIRAELEMLARGRKDEDFLFSANGKDIWSRKHIGYELQKRLEEEGIDKKDLTFHSCRYFFNSYLYLQAGVDKERIKSVIGHSSDNMFRHYLTVDAETDLKEIREAQKKIL